MSSNHFPHLSCTWGDPHDWDTLNIMNVPDEPGYYAFTNHADGLQPSAAGKSVLYVGIATQKLRDRIRKYKTGDVQGTKGLMNLHARGFFLMLSRASAHYDGNIVTHSVQRTPVSVINKGTGAQSVLMPDAIYLRWAVDYRAAIEALLIQQLNPRFNTMLVQD